MANEKMNVKFLTGTDVNKLPAYSADTIGQIYFLVDVPEITGSEENELDKTGWSGKIIYDSPQARIVMSTHAVDAEYVAKQLQLENNLTYNGSETVHIGNTIHYLTSATSTAGSWVGESDSITEYYNGLTVIYVPTVAGGSTATKLKINNLDAKDCYYNRTDKLTTQLSTDKPILFIYQNGAWRRPGSALTMKVTDEVLEFNI